MIAHASQPALRRQEVIDLYESKISPFYIMCFGSTRNSKLFFSRTNK